MSIPSELYDQLTSFLQRHFGDEISHPTLGSIVIDESVMVEYDIAYAVAVNTVRYLATRDGAYGLMSGGIVIPKDGFPVHWAPTMWSDEVYVEKVRNGEMWWSATGAEVPTSVTYWGKVEPTDPERRVFGIVRRRTIGESVVDEAFTRSLRWEPTWFLRRYDLGHNDLDLVEINEMQAGEFVRALRDKVQQRERG